MFVLLQANGGSDDIGVGFFSGVLRATYFCFARAVDDNISVCLVLAAVVTRIMARSDHCLKPLDFRRMLFVLIACTSRVPINEAPTFTALILDLVFHLS